MSHILKTQLTNLTSKETLVTALKNMGYGIQEGNISAYQGATSDTEFHVQQMKSVGFRQTESGNYEMVADFWKTNVNKEDFVHDLQGEYQAVEVAKAIPRNWKVSNTTKNSGKIRIEIVERL
jgi:hypothetical protein